MKILWLSHLVPYPPKAGVLARAYYLIRELARYHDVDVLAFHQKNLHAPFYESDVEALDDARMHLISFINRFEIFPIKSDQYYLGKYWLAFQSLFTKDPYNMNWLKSSNYRKTLHDWLNSKSYDLVHFDTLSLLPFFDDCINVTRLALDHHNIESHMLYRRAGKESNLLKKIYFLYEASRVGYLERKYCPRFSLNLVCSDIDRNRLQRLVPDAKILIVENGVDIDSFQPPENRRDPCRVIFFGTMDWYPNRDAVLFILHSLWPGLKNKYPNLSIDIVGANPPKELIDYSLNNTDFRVHGFVDKLSDIADKAGIFICPIRDGGGTKLKILDACAMGMAIIAHPIACEGIDLHDEQDVLFAETPQQYQKQIGRLIESPKKILQLGKNARKLVEDKYAFTSIGRLLSEAYETLPGN